MKKSLAKIFAGLTYLPDRKPELVDSEGGANAFAEVAAFDAGAIYVGHYSGSSEWERHSSGDELVMALAGATTIVLLVDSVESRISLAENELIVVPAGTWHRFEASEQLKVLTLTPGTTEHSLVRPV